MRKLLEYGEQVFYDRHIGMRVVKYNPKYYDGINGYQKDEWISVSDIGTTFDNILFTKEEYLRVEKQHIDAILFLKQFVNADFLRLSIMSKFRLKTIPIFSNEENRLKSTFRQLKIEDEYNNKEIIIDILKLSLREELGLPLLSFNNNEVLIDFGYDYYMRFWFRKVKNNEIFINNLDKLKTQIEDLGLFVDIYEFKNRKKLQYPPLQSIIYGLGVGSGNI